MGDIVGGILGARWVHGGGAVFSQQCTHYLSGIQEVYSEGCTGAQFFFVLVVYGYSASSETWAERNWKENIWQFAEIFVTLQTECAK